MHRIRRYLVFPTLRLRSPAKCRSWLLGCSWWMNLGGIVSIFSGFVCSSPHAGKHELRPTTADVLVERGRVGALRNKPFAEGFALRSSFWRTCLGGIWDIVWTKFQFLPQYPSSVDLDRFICWARWRMESVGVFTTISFTVAISSVRNDEFLLLQGC